MCGDCTLAESTYICPQSGCPKKLLNGPCGGSRNMTCEVYPERYCFWVRVYNRLRPQSTIEQLGTMSSLPPKNWALDRTSSWINFYTGRDHHRIGIKNDKEHPQ
jgi:methylenetetrahydrofolate reductase (NADPH)